VVSHYARYKVSAEISYIVRLARVSRSAYRQLRCSSGYHRTTDRCMHSCLHPTSSCATLDEIDRTQYLHAYIRRHPRPTRDQFGHSSRTHSPIIAHLVQLPDLRYEDRLPNRFCYERRFCGKVLENNNGGAFGNRDTKTIGGISF
jgi:hypothetical protein